MGGGWRTGPQKKMAKHRRGVRERCQDGVKWAVMLLRACTHTHTHTTHTRLYHYYILIHTNTHLSVGFVLTYTQKHTQSSLPSGPACLQAPWLSGGDPSPH